MVAASDFTTELEAKVAQQLKSQRVGYLLGAGSSHLNGNGYPFAFQLWDLIKDSITDAAKRDDIQAKLIDGANGIEEALDLLDDGGANDTPYRHLVTAALDAKITEILRVVDEIQGQSRPLNIYKNTSKIPLDRINRII
jgi:hypothetical protein